MVIDYSAGLRVLNLQNEAKAFNFTTKNISIAEDQNHNAGYIFFRHQEAEQSLILLLPDKRENDLNNALGKKFSYNNRGLVFVEYNAVTCHGYVEFDSDFSYTDKKTQGVERFAFHCMLKQYGLESNTIIRTILGLYDPK
ncbi:hypothetical protein RhiirC2_785137 [Rhizophagus irregularis]|uniref:Uncharacterized protein n=1 Tax=Rhizophagus irregularis TaxID=588596 RepID=A0A2N1MWZ9_9GLOM|nr:hypothetical protein RhiirC2_785137 [Rhizophagus irregularis]